MQQCGMLSLESLRKFWGISSIVRDWPLRDSAGETTLSLPFSSELVLELD